MKTHRSSLAHTLTRRGTLAGLLALPLVSRAAEDSSDRDLLTVREGVWRHWFNGNGEALMAILPADFVGIGAGGGQFQSRTETIANSEAFAASGGKLTALQFTDNHIQRIGEVWLLYGGFSFTTEDKAGKSSTVEGRCTEVFARSGNKWSHPGWHLDSGQ